MTPIEHESDSFRIARTALIIPRAQFAASHVTLELPVDMAMQLRSMCGSFGTVDGELASTQRFPIGKTTADYMSGPFFTAAEVHGLAVLIHIALKRAGV